MTVLPSAQVGETFFYQGRKYKSLAAVEQAEAAFIAKAEKSAGRPLSLLELLRGLPHPEDRDRAAQIHDKAFYVQTVTPPTADAHPFDAAQHSLDNRVQSREQLRDQMRAKYDQRLAGAIPDPDAGRRADAVAHAHELLHSVMYSPHVPASIVEQARQCVVRAQRGDLNDYKSHSAALIVKIAEHKTDRVVAADLRRATELADLPAQFEPIEPLADKPAPPPGTLHAKEDIMRADPATRYRMVKENEAVRDAVT